MRPGWVGAVLALVLVAAACADAGEPPDSGFSLDLGTASRSRPLTSDETRQLQDEFIGIDEFGSGFDLRGCVLYYPGRYLVRLEASTGLDLDYPALLYIQPTFGSTQGMFGIGTGTLTVDGPGPFAVDVRIGDYAREADREGVSPLIAAEGGQALGRWSRCDANVLAADSPGVVGRAAGEGVPVEIGPLAPPAAEDGTIQALARRADWTDQFDPWRALAVIDGTGARLFADRVLLPETGWTIDTIDEEVTQGGCYRVVTLYRQTDAPGLARLVQQDAACEPLDRPDEVMTDGSWQVGIYSDVTTREALTSVLSWYRNLDPRSREDLAGLAN